MAFLAKLSASASLRRPGIRVDEGVATAYDTGPTHFSGLVYLVDSGLMLISVVL